MLYTKFMPGRTLAHASRNRRELEVAKDCGFNIEVICSDDKMYFKDHFPQYRYVSDGYVKVSYNLSKPKRYALIIWGIIKVFCVARHVKADIVSCHDLDSLWMFWLAMRFKRHRPKLIYDSHEFEIGRNKKRSRLQLWYVSHLECFLMKRCAFSMMVNDVIADEVQRIHKLKERPIVVRNIPNYWEVDKSVCINQRNELLSEMDSPRDFMLMYHGGVTGGRGIEMLLQVVSVNKNVCLVVLGNAVPVYLSTLQHQVEELGIMERVLFHPAVPIKDLWKYVGAADVGMITIPAIAKSYYYMLPNKFFENIQSETPVICSNFPAIEPLVNQFGLGLSCSPTDLDAINKCVERLRVDKDFYNRCKENAKLAKKHLCWRKEKEKLINMFCLLNCH